MGQKIAACLVVYNEEKVIDKCLSSIAGLVDEMIVVHDGECADRTLEIAKKYTDKIFIRPHVGIAEPHRSFAYQKAQSDWILQIDADEYIEESDSRLLKELVKIGTADAYLLRWELWNGKLAVNFTGLRKLCLFRRDMVSFAGIPQQVVSVNGEIKNADITLRHRPLFSNIGWASFFKKTRKWVPIHAKYFFPNLVTYECFNDTPEKWIRHTEEVRKNVWRYMVVVPAKTFIGQLIHGQWRSWYGWQFALQQAVYNFMLYKKVYELKKQYGG